MWGGGLFFHNKYWVSANSSPAPLIAVLQNVFGPFEGMHKTDIFSGGSRGRFGVSIPSVSLLILFLNKNDVFFWICGGVISIIRYSVISQLCN